MYEGGRGGGGAGAGGGLPIVGGGILLPNTGGNTLLTILAILAITVGVAIIVTSVIRDVTARAYKQAG